MEEKKVKPANIPYKGLDREALAKEREKLQGIQKPSSSASSQKFQESKEESTDKTLLNKLPDLSNEKVLYKVLDISSASNGEKIKSNNNKPEVKLSLKERLELAKAERLKRLQEKQNEEEK